MDREKFGLWTAIIALIVIASLMGISRYSPRAEAGPEEAPRAAILNVVWNTTGIATNTNATASQTQFYSYMDTACDIDQNVGNAITITMMSSPDNSSWYTTTELFANSTGDVTVFTRTLSYQRYEQLRFTVTNGNTVTPVCKSTYFSNWMPSGLIRVY